MIARLLYRIRPDWFRLRVVCAWCQTLIAPPGIFSRGETSHGICGPCSAKAAEEFRTARQLRRHLAALLFFAAILSVSCSRRENLATDRTFVYRPQMHASIAVPTPQCPSLEIQP